MWNEATPLKRRLTNTMKRRDFIRRTALMAGAAGLANHTFAAEKGKLLLDKQSSADDPLIVSAPMLQNYAETSIGVAFAVSDCNLWKTTRLGRWQESEMWWFQND